MAKIHLPGRNLEKLKPTQQPIVRLSPEAYNVLIEITNETYLSLKQVASEIILQSQALIVYDRDKEDQEK